MKSKYTNICYLYPLHVFTFIRRQKCSPASLSKRANSSLSSRISSSAVHWAESAVKPQMSANSMLQKNMRIYRSNHINEISMINITK